MTEPESPAFDPVLTVARLAQFSLYPAGTKLYVRGNALYIQPPSIVQPLSRWFAGDSRDDLTFLYEPLRKFTYIYQLQTSEEQKTLLKVIIDHAIRGLETLRTIYQHHRAINHSLAYYQTYLVQCLRPSNHNSPYLGAIMPLAMNFSSSSPIAPATVNTTSDEDSRSDTSSVSDSEETETPKVPLGAWTMSDVQMLRSMIISIVDVTNDDEKPSRLKALDAFLDSKHTPA